MVFAINPPSSGHTFDAFQALAIAQNGTNATTPATNATSPSVSASNIVVNVGKDGQLRYDPQNVTAKVGDTIEFLFNPKNHTVTRSDFGSPCQPLVDTSANDTRAFDSGL
jgi:plastocyanin